MVLKVYDSAPLVQFPARHSGRLEVEDWVDPEPVIFNEYYEYYEYYEYHDWWCSMNIMNSGRLEVEDWVEPQPVIYLWFPTI